MVPNKRELKSYVWHDDKCFFVSTIERDSSARMPPPASRFHETIAWEYDWETTERGAMVAQDGGGPAFRQHYLICEQLFKTGKYKEDSDDDAT